MRVKVALQSKPLIEARAKENLKTKGKEPLLISAKAVNTRNEIAKLAGVGHDTVQKVEKVLKEATEPVKAAMLSGKTTINAAHKTLKPKPIVEVEEADEYVAPKPRPGVGIERAHEAIARLRSIPVNDPHWARARSRLPSLLFRMGE